MKTVAPRTTSKNSRDAEKFVARLRDGQRDRIQAMAVATHRSMNDVMCYAVDLVLDGEDRQKALLDALERELAHQQALNAELTQFRNEAAAELAELRAEREKVQA